MKTLFVRVHPKRGVERFFRCGTWFTLAWQKLTDLDDATAKRLRTEQMLEVSADEPEGFAAATANTPTESAAGTAATHQAPGGNEADDEVAQRLLAIQGAIAQMDRTDESLWTSGGKPKTEALTAALGWNVSAMERDAVMAQDTQGEEQA